MEQIQSLAFELRELLLESNEYKKVKEIEKRLLDKEWNLITDFKKAEQDYNDSIKYGYYEEKYLTNLQKSKEILYSNPLTREYFDALKEMNKLLHEISEGIFKDIVPDLKIK